MADYSPKEWTQSPAWLTRPMGPDTRTSNGRIPVTTSPGTWTMRAHNGPVPEATKLSASLYRIALAGVTGAQHNPSVAVVDDRLLVTVRVLYDRHTTNFLARVGDDWQLEGTVRITPGEWGLGSRPLRVMRFDGKEWPSHVEIEDLRLIVWQGRLWAIGAVHDGSISAIRQCLMQIADDGSLVEAHLQPSDKHEKNWMPAVDDGRLRLVYSVDPLIVLDVEDCLAVPPADELKPKPGFVRGGSQAIAYKDGYLAIVHQVHKPSRTEPTFNPLMGGWAPAVKDPVAGDESAVYQHQFARFTRDLSSVVLSRPFYFRWVGVEFVAGLARYRDTLIASFGVADSEAWLAEIADSAIEEMFSLHE